MRTSENSPSPTLGLPRTPVNTLARLKTTFLVFLAECLGASPQCFEEASLFFLRKPRHQPSFYSGDHPVAFVTHPFTALGEVGLEHPPVFWVLSALYEPQALQSAQDLVHGLGGVRNVGRAGRDA